MNKLSLITICLIVLLACCICVIPAYPIDVVDTPPVSTQPDTTIQYVNNPEPIPLDYIEEVFDNNITPVAPTNYDMLDMYTPETFAPIKTYEYAQYTLNMPLSVELQEHTYNMSLKYDVPFEIIMGLMGVEAGWKANIGTKTNGNATYVGLGMMRDIYHVERFKKQGIDIYTPKGNIEAICILIREKLEYYDGNITFALMAYNRGIGGANKVIKNGTYTTGYDQKIMKYVNSFTYDLA